MKSRKLSDSRKRPTTCCGEIIPPLAEQNKPLPRRPLRRREKKRTLAALHHEVEVFLDDVGA